MAKLKLKKIRFGTLGDGSKVHLFTVSNGRMSFSVSDFGCTLTSILISDKKTGLKKDVLLGHSTLDGYVNSSSCYGTVVGRFANRIGGASFTLDGKTYNLDKNDCGTNCLHGGFDRYEKKVWSAKKIKNSNGLGVEFTRLSPDGEQGLPGNALIRVTYTLSMENEVMIDYVVITDRPTPVNLTNHAYFNLKGTDGGTVKDHELSLLSSKFLELNETLVPTGTICSVDEIPAYDFRNSKKIGQDIDKVGDGYDTPYIIDGADGQLKPFGVLRSPDGVSMTMSTTLPAVQIYTANFIEGNIGKFGRVYNKHDAVCIETEGYPDAPNHDNFPSCIVTPQKPYHEQTVYRFSF